MSVSTLNSWTDVNTLEGTIEMLGGDDLFVNVSAVVEGNSAVMYVYWGENNTKSDFEDFGDLVLLTAPTKLSRSFSRKGSRFYVKLVKPIQGDFSELNIKTVLTKDSSNRLDQTVDTVNVYSSTLATESTLASIATESTLSTLNNKIITCDTSELASQTTLSSIDGKITTCDTSGLASQTTLSQLDNRFTNLSYTNTSVNVEISNTEVDVNVNNSSLTTHCYGSHDGTTFIPLKTSNSGVLNTSSENTLTSSSWLSSTNLQSGGSASSSFDVDANKSVDLLMTINSVSSIGSLVVQVSHNNTDWWDSNYTIFINSGDTKKLSQIQTACKYIRLRPDNSINVNVNVVVSMKMF